MIPSFHEELIREESLLKERIKLYNNVCRLHDCTGRLECDLHVYPSPQIVWEFETLAEESDKLQIGSLVEGKLEHPFEAVDFALDGIRQNELMFSEHACIRLRGVASMAYLGKINYPFSSAAFYLPNAQFHRVKAPNKEGYSMTLPLDGTWSIRLETRKEALEWLDPQKGNNGSLLTTVGRLYYPTKRAKGSPGERPVLTFDELQYRIGNLCRLLSYANGGYLGPIIVLGSYHIDQWIEQSVIISPHRTTPLEQIGKSWLAWNSSLDSYIRCYSTFDRMLSSPAWKDTFDLILAWYFQAIQPQNAQLRDKPWPIKANALGTALERLCYTILVLEENDPSQLAANERLFKVGKSQERIARLLKRMGITKERNHNDSDLVEYFTTVRNDATHPRASSVSMSDAERELILQYAIQWIDEVLLWRLGYDATYISRSEGGQPIQPRYDLALRDPSW